MAEVTVSDLRSNWSITSQISDTRLTLCLTDAVDEVKTKIGVEAYREVFLGDTATIEDSEYLDTNVTTTDEIALRTSRVTKGVHYYAIADLVLNTMLNFRATGLLKQEQDAGSPAMNSSSQVINEYLSPKEAKEYSEWLRTKGDRALGLYVVEQAPTNANAWGRSARG